MQLLRQNQGSRGIAKKDKSKPLWPAVEPQSNFYKENALFTQVPQERDKCTSTQTPRCRCKLILPAHITGYMLQDPEERLWVSERLRRNQLWLHSRNEYKGNLVTHKLRQHPLLTCA